MLCHRFVTVTAAQKIGFISNPRGIEKLHVFARARGTRPHGDKMGGWTIFRLLLQNGWVKHRDLLRIFGGGVMQQAASVGTV